MMSTPLSRANPPHLAKHNRIVFPHRLKRIVFIVAIFPLWLFCFLLDCIVNDEFDFNEWVKELKNGLRGE